MLSDTGVGIKKGDELDVLRYLGQTNRNVSPPFLPNGLVDFRAKTVSNDNIEDNKWSGDAKKTPASVKFAMIYKPDLRFIENRRSLSATA